MIDEKKLIDDLKQSGMIADNEYGNAMVDMIESQPKIGGWIPCSERLPEEEGTYLVTRPNLGNWITETMYFCRDSFTDKYVIAWQPLPDVYHRYMEN